MTKAGSSKAKPARRAPKSPAQRYARAKKPFDAHASKSRGLLKERIRTIQNQLGKVWFDLYGIGPGEEE